MTAVIGVIIGIIGIAFGLAALILVLLLRSTVNASLGIYKYSSILIFSFLDKYDPLFKCSNKFKWDKLIIINNWNLSFCMFILYNY